MYSRRDVKVRVGFIQKENSLENPETLVQNSADFSSYSGNFNM